MNARKQYKKAKRDEEKEHLIDLVNEIEDARLDFPDTGYHYMTIASDSIYNDVEAHIIIHQNGYIFAEIMIDTIIVLDIMSKSAKYVVQKIFDFNNNYYRFLDVHINAEVEYQNAAGITKEERMDMHELLTHELIAAFTDDFDD